MHLLDLFESTNEGYTVTRGIDRDRYQERAGLEGPFQTKSGKVVYYDKKEGKYYDPDSDMYIDHDDYAELDEGVGTYLKGAVLAGLLGLGVNQMASMTDAKNSPLGQAMAQAAEQGDQYAAKHLEKLDAYFDLNDTGSIKVLSQKYLGKTLESVYEEVATNKRTERILGLLRAKNPTAQNDLEALIMSFDKGQKQDRSDINTLYSQNREEDKEIEALEKELESLKKRRGMNEDYYETDEQRELARLGRILKDMGKKRDDNVGEAMGFLGTQLTRYGTPQGVNSIEKLEQVTGLPESTIMKMLALAQKVQGDVAVGDETASNDEEEVEEGYKKDYLTREKERIGRASDERDVGTNNWEVKIDGKPWKVFRTKASAIKASSTIQNRYGKETTVFATRKPVSEGIAEDFDTNFSKRVGATVRGGKGAEYLKRKAKERQAQNKKLDPRAAEIGLGINVLDAEKARKKAAEKGVEFPRTGVRTSPRTHDPKRLPEGLDHDIKIGDTVETKKMGQMQGVVTGFSTKYGDTRVMFKHKSGKVYATPASNLRVIDKVEEASRPTKMRFPGERFSKELNTQDFELSSMYDHRSIDQLYQSLSNANSAIQKVTLKVEKLQDAGKKPVKTQQALDVLIRKRDYISDLIDQKEMQDEGVAEGGFFDPDQPNPGDMVKHVNGAVGKVKKIGTQGDETWVYFKDKNGEMNYGLWKKHVFPMENTAKKSESQVVENIDLRHNLQPGTYKHREENITVTINSDSSVSFKQPAEWEIEGDGEYLEFVETQLADASNWTAVVEEAKKKPVPTKPDLWSRAKAAAKQKYDVWPSAYASAFAAKWYKEKGGGWRMGKAKK